MSNGTPAAARLQRQGAAAAAGADGNRTVDRDVVAGLADTATPERMDMPPSFRAPTPHPVVGASRVLGRGHKGIPHPHGASTDAQVEPPTEHAGRSRERSTPVGLRGGRRPEWRPGARPPGRGPRCAGTTSGTPRAAGTRGRFLSATAD